MTTTSRVLTLFVLMAAALLAAPSTAEAQTDRETCRKRCFNLFPSDPNQIPNGTPSCSSSSVRQRWSQYCRYQSCISNCMRSLNVQRHRAQQAADDNAFARASRTNTVYSYQQYLRKYPRGRHSQAARARISGVQSQNDARAFEEARRRHRVYSYKGYIRRYPRGRYVMQARNAMIQLQGQKRTANRARYARLARRADSEASGYRIKGVLRLLGGIVIAGGGIALWATKALGDAASPALGGVLIGSGIVLLAINPNWRKARGASSSARYFRRKMRSASNPPDTRGLGLAYRWGF